MSSEGPTKVHVKWETLHLTESHRHLNVDKEEPERHRWKTDAPLCKRDQVSEVTGHRSQVTGHMSQVTGHRSQQTALEDRWRALQERPGQ